MDRGVWPTAVPAASEAGRASLPARGNRRRDVASGTSRAPDTCLALSWTLSMPIILSTSRDLGRHGAVPPCCHRPCPGVDYYSVHAASLESLNSLFSYVTKRFSRCLACALPSLFALAF